jgi:actin-related protein 6
VVQEYVLPNFASRRVGHIRSTGEDLLATDQVLYMGNERFLVPEILFHPDDIGE